MSIGDEEEGGEDRIGDEKTVVKTKIRNDKEKYRFTQKNLREWATDEVSYFVELTRSCGGKK